MDSWAGSQGAGRLGLDHVLIQPAQQTTIWIRASESQPGVHTQRRHTSRREFPRGVWTAIRLQPIGVHAIRGVELYGQGAYRAVECDLPSAVVVLARGTFAEEFRRMIRAGLRTPSN
jgi:hypothetical protein